MLVLFETAAGFALFQLLDEEKLSEVEDLAKHFVDASSAKKIVTLKAFCKLDNAIEQLRAAKKIIHGAPSKSLRRFLRAHCENVTLAVADSSLGNAIKQKLNIDCVHNKAVMELMRGIRSRLPELISDVSVQDLALITLKLSRSLSRYKLHLGKKVDTMIPHAIGMLDELDKKLNTYAMSVREWYGCHFPELANVIPDNIVYVKAVVLVGDRSNAAGLDFSEILSEADETELKEAAVISVGTEISELDLFNIKEWCNHVVSLMENRAELHDYLESRMNTVAPNLTASVGVLVGARLIAQTGGLKNLAMEAGSSLQLLGAEKSLFKAIEKRRRTPKHGHIYLAPLICEAASENKGKLCRMLAAQCALAARIDFLGEVLL